ncbi:hypothetical protein AUJ17_01645 [Candidatus Micrarchaeota archaeon CG1_02_47_40]|nr:MAG: hypothetical protein AUJ17_01645 [Candidatus Micrarchaeota archaeon CG1_02_47_40]
MPPKNLTKNSILKLLNAHRTDFKQYSVKKLGLFGSYLNGKPKKNSDIDLFVELEKPTFDNYMELKFLLEGIFSRKIDLVTEGALKPALKYIKKEAAYAEVA